MASLEVEMGASLPLLASQPSLTGQGETPISNKGWSTAEGRCLRFLSALHMHAYIYSPLYGCIYMYIYGEIDRLIDISPTHVNTHTHSREKI